MKLKVGNRAFVGWAILFSILIMVFVLPIFAYAAESLRVGPTGGGLTLLTGFIRFINRVLIPLLIAIAVLVFLYGVVTYVLRAGDEEKQKESKWFAVYGLVGIFIIVSVWGLVNLLGRTFGLNYAGPTLGDLPEVGGGGSYNDLGPNWDPSQID